RRREHPAEVPQHGVDHDGSSPVSRRWTNAASSMIGTPSDSALVSLEAPGDSPTTTAVVDLDTLPGDLPPRDLMAASASSRVKPASVPVTTMDLPASTCDVGSTGSGPTKLTPAARRRSMISRLRSSRK